MDKSNQYFHIRPLVLLSNTELENEGVQFQTYLGNGGCGSFEMWLQARYYGKGHTRLDRLDFIDYKNRVIDFHAN